MRRLRLWALLSETVPFYPLYALFFADVGLSDAEISGLFVVWSVVGIVAEVPSGALADRFCRRGVLALGGLAQAAAYVLWTAWPGFGAFAVGFALWGIGGALVSGSVEALLHDGLAAVGAAERFGPVYGQLEALRLAADVPAAVAATVLFAAGGFSLVGWVSVGGCLAAAVLAAGLPEPSRRPEHDAEEPADPERPATYFGVLRAGAAEALAEPVVRGAVLAVALLSALDAIEEYFGLMAQDWDVPTGWVPLALTGIALAGALGAASAGRLVGIGARALTALFACSVLLFAIAGLAADILGLFAVAAFYLGYRAVLVVANTWLQQRVRTTARATVTSFVGFGTEFVCLLVYGAWAVGQVFAVVALALVAVVTLPYGFGPRHDRVAR